MVLVYWTTLKIVIDRYRYLSTLTEDIMKIENIYFFW